jgi:hypothetical protein
MDESITGTFVSVASRHPNYERGQLREPPWGAKKQQPAGLLPSPDEGKLHQSVRAETVTLHRSTVTVAEIGCGVWVLPEGERRRSLERRFERFVAEVVRPEDPGFRPSLRGPLR